MTRPEDIARDRIDKRLQLAGWVVQDIKTFNPAAGRGVAVREYPTDTGPADCVLLVNRQAVGVIEAKRDEEGQPITDHETQTERYARSGLKWRQGGKPLRFLFEATGEITRFTDTADPAPRSREVLREDFVHAEFGKRGGLQRAWGLFESGLDGLLEEMNTALVA